MKKLLLVLAVLLLFAPNVFAGYNYNPFTRNFDFTTQFEETDGSPSMQGPTKVIVPNGTLTDNGNNTATFNPGRVATSTIDYCGYYSDVATISGDSGCQFDPATDTLTVSILNATGSLNRVTGTTYGEYLDYLAGGDGHLRFVGANGAVANRYIDFLLDATNARITTDSNPLEIYATERQPLEIIREDAATNTTVTVARIQRLTTGTAQASIGASLDWLLENGSGTATTSFRQSAILSTVTNGAENAQINESIISAGTLTQKWLRTKDGYMFFNGSTTPTAPVDIAAGSTSAAQLRLRTTGSSPTSPNEGDMWLHTTQQALKGYFGGITQALEGVIYTSTATATVANTTNETSIIGSGVGTLTLPANFFVAGKNVRVRVRGILSDTGTPTLNIKVKLGSTVIAQTTAIALAGTISNNYFEAEAGITCRTTGASGTVIAQGHMIYDESTHAGTMWGMANTAATTIDTTASQALDVTATWGTGVSANTISGTNATVEVLN